MRTGLIPFVLAAGVLTGLVFVDVVPGLRFFRHVPGWPAGVSGRLGA